MSSTNGSTNGSSAGRKQAVLYARVSTVGQIDGYSLDQQLHALRSWAAREGYGVLEEVRDGGHSGAYLERPGLDRVRDLVEGASGAGGVAVVVAQDADRITREPAHRAFLDADFERFGTRLLALDDWGDGTHEGELLRYMKGWVAKGERLKIAQRTNRGRRQKAREGKVVATHPPRYGFRFARDATGKAVGYEVDEAQMRVVRRIFEMLAVDGLTLYGVRKRLEADGVRSPRGKRLWHQGYLRGMVLDDIYRPHAHDEIASIVPPQVAATLDRDGTHGACYYGRRRQTRRSNGHGLSYETSHVPREEWLAVPVPDSGIPRGWIDAARESIKDNRRPSAAGLRFWELSGACCAAPRAGGPCRRHPSR